VEAQREVARKIAPGCRDLVKDGRWERERRFYSGQR
jgi:hypothetical protein